VASKVQPTAEVKEHLAEAPTALPKDAVKEHSAVASKVQPTAGVKEHLAEAPTALPKDAVKEHSV